jgi:allophanate hydrolase
VALFFDADDPLARAADAAVVPRFGSRFRFGVPKWSDLEFFGDKDAAALFATAICILEKAGGTRVEMSFATFREAGQLLYEGPWVAERLYATQALLNQNPGAVLPITRSILEDARGYSALDAYRAQYELAALRRAVDGMFATIDVLLVPTAGTNYEIAAVVAEPKRLNANLGFYTNFVNLLDLAAIAIPAGFSEGGLPFGITLIAQAFRDSALIDLGTRCQESIGLPLGAARV